MTDPPNKEWFDAAFDPYIATDQSGVILEWNESACELLGWSRAEAVGQSVAELLIPSRYRRDHTDGLRRYLDLGTGEGTMINRRVEVQALLRDRSEIPVEITIWPDRATGATRFNAFLRDLRPRRQAEAQSIYLASVVQSSQDAIITKTLEGEITSWNPAAERVFGYCADGAVGQSIMLLVPPDRHEEEREILARLRQGELIEHYETQRMTRTGQLLDVSLTISPIRGPDATVIGASTILRDITERKRIEAALREERRMLETLNRVGLALASNLDLDALLQAVTDAATALCGAQFGAFFFASQAVCETRNYKLATFSGAAREAFAQLGQTRVIPLFVPTFEGRRVIRIDDVLCDSPQQQERSSSESAVPGASLLIRSYLAVPVISRSGILEGGLFFGHPEPGVFNERLERLIAGLAAHAAIAIDNARLFEERNSLLESERSARVRAERISASKDEFLAALSHELRTPLNAILGWATVLERNAGGKEEFARGLEVIRRNVRAQSRLVDDLMDMSRIVSGQMRLDLQSVMPVSFVQAAVDSLRPLADARSVRIDTLLDPRAGPVTGDPWRLQQVIWNLVSNGIKFTSEGGVVRVVLRRDIGQVEITVSDTGIGIPAEFLPYVFERYRQADASMTRKHGGLGLGLAIAKHIVDLHGGVVRASSSGAGQGSTFTLLLPTARADGAALQPAAGASIDARTAATPPQAGSLDGLRVLVVDDEADVRLLLTRILEDAGARVMTAGSAGEAIDIAGALRPAVVVSDIGMPEIDGYELLRRMRSLDCFRESGLKAIALTAFARPEDRTRALLSGFLAHISKPVEPATLVAAVASAALAAPGRAHFLRPSPRTTPLEDG